jgi:hypothetical protein
LAVSCSSPPGPPPAAIPDQRYELVGASVYPPKAEGWLVVRHTEQNLVFFKQGPTALGMRGAWLLSWDEDEEFPNVEAFRAEMESRIRSEFDNERFSDLELEVTVDPSFGDFVLRSHAKSRDHEVPGFAGDFMFMESYGRIFLHPDDPSMGVWVDFSERSDPGTGLEDLRAQAEAYIASLEILPFGG